MNSTTPLREVVGLFDDSEGLETAIDALLESGFDRAHISLLASERHIEKSTGHPSDSVREYEDDPNVPRTEYVSSASLGDAEGVLIGTPMYVAALTAAGIAASAGGPLAALILAAAAAGGGGALLGTALAKIVDKRHADYIEQQVEHGGLLLWVRTSTAEREARAKGILASHSAHHVHVHDLHALGAQASAADPGIATNRNP